MSFWLIDTDLNRYDFPRGNISGGFPVNTKRTLIDLAYGHGKKDIGDQKIGARRIRVTTLLNGDTGGLVRQICSCESVDNWTHTFDALAEVVNTTYVKQGTYSLELETDWNLHGNDYASWTLDESFGDLTDYQSDWLYMWLYLPTTDYLRTPSYAIEVRIGSAAGASKWWTLDKGDLSVGWNLLEFDFGNPGGTTGAPDWTVADYFLFKLHNTGTSDFSVYLDDIKIWRISYQAEWDDLMRWLGKHDLKFYKDTSRYINVETMDLRSHSFIIGDSKATAELELNSVDPFFYKDSETTESTWTVAASPSTENVFNEGNIDCYPTIEITATASLASGITLKNQTDDDVLFSYEDSVFLTGKKLTIDCHNGTVDLDGTNTIRYFDGQFLRLLEGVNTLEYTGGNCTIVIKHRDRWV